MPMQEVASHYDCDYWRLRSSCSRANIPIPPKGYWMKVQHRKPLPERPALGPHQYDIVVLRVGKRSENAVETAMMAQAESETIRHSCKVPVRLANPHPAVIEIMSDRIRWSSNPQLNAILSGPLSACVRRGFIIADVIAKAAVANGFDVQPLQDGGLAISSVYRNTNIRVRERLQLKQKVI
jgi:hypothetical protein